MLAELEQDVNYKAFNSTLQYYNEKNHYPSEAMLSGIRKLQETLTAMCLGQAEEKYHLCSLDPGVGKSTAIIQWLKVYKETPSLYESTGVILAFDRYEEIRRFIDESGIPDNFYSVLVTEKHELNSSGRGYKDINNAPVLFTTKQQIVLRSKKNKTFKGTEAVHYKGKARNVKIWDESFLAGRAITLDRLEIGKVFTTIQSKAPRLSETVEGIFTNLKTCPNGSIYQMPLIDISLPELLHMFDGRGAEQKVAELLGILSGKEVTVRTDHRGQVLVDCIEALPEDFAPCLITDGSGRIKEVYNLQEQYRKDILNITPSGSGKLYDNLTVSVWRRGSGKSHYSREGVEDTANEIIKVINSKSSTEEFLIVVFKDMEERMKKSVHKGLKLGDHSRIKFLTYGRHLATNEYSEIPNIIVAGMMFYRLADCEATARAAATLKTSEGKISNDEISRVLKSEALHHLYQAVCRGTVRKSVGNSCKQSNLWLIADPKTGIEEALPMIFPMCKVTSWKTEVIPLTGLIEKAYNYIVSTLSNGIEELSGLALRKYLDVKKQSNFKRDVLNNSELRDRLAEAGISLEKQGNKFFYIRPDFISYFSVV